MKFIKTVSGKNNKIAFIIDERMRKKADAKKELVDSLKEGKKVSDCCGASDGCTTPVGIKGEGPWYSDIGICPICKEHCEFVKEE